jgi:glyoxylase-like metal-dependent hydrolase (beta-lactamase superfamily II)
MTTRFCAPRWPQTATDAKGGLYEMRPRGGNSFVLVRDEGVVLIDSKLPGWSQPVLDKVALVTDRPVTMTINTHAHLDHTGGNLELPRLACVPAA